MVAPKRAERKVELPRKPAGPKQDFECTQKANTFRPSTAGVIETKQAMELTDRTIDTVQAKQHPSVIMKDLKPDSTQIHNNIEKILRNVKAGDRADSFSPRKSPYKMME